LTTWIEDSSRARVHAQRVLEHYLCDGGEGGNWTHHPELVMLGIKADHMRFKVGE
jgi:hypothetical protein